MGKATILFHSSLVLVQLAILRKDFNIRALLQIPVGIIFGYFTTFSNYLFSFLPTPENMVIRLGLIVISAAALLVGNFLGIIKRTFGKTAK